MIFTYNTDDVIVFDMEKKKVKVITPMDIAETLGVTEQYKKVLREQHERDVDDFVTGEVTKFDYNMEKVGDHYEQAE